MSLIFSFIIFSLIIILGYLIKKWANGPMNPNKKDLTGKLIIVTGSSDGIGLETAKDLLNSNATVIFACRNKNKTESIINNFPERIKKKAIFIPLNLDSFKSIKNFADEIKSKFPKIDILINNAGMAPRTTKNKTEDGYFYIYQVNYLGNVLLTLLLLEHFNEKESKIINVSSRGYRMSKLTYGDSKYLNNYDLMFKYFTELRRKIQFYGDTKLLLNYFTQYLANLAEEKYPYLKVFCLHPGFILTNAFAGESKLFNLIFNLTFKNIFYLFSKDIIHGAQTTLFLSYSDNKDLINGAFYKDCGIEKYTPLAKDEKIRNEMVNETLNILKGKFKELEYLPLSK